MGSEYLSLSYIYKHEFYAAVFSSSRIGIY